jgi:threonine/homoserine/homoserine lactone efflux protein
VAWTTYGSFLVVAVILVLVPGADFAVTTRNTLADGRTRGAWTAVGVASSTAVQGLAAAAGLGALLVRAQPLFQVIRWVGVAYLLHLGVQALRAAVAGRYATDDDGPDARPGKRLAGWRQGFVCNMTNPKVLVFYLAVLPQFLTPGAGAAAMLGYALSHALLSLTYLMILTACLHRARRVLSRRRVRRALDGLTGTAMVAFGARIAVDRG